MLIVIDTTMIFSLLLGKNEAMRDVFFDSKHRFYSPNYIVAEIFEKKEKILRCSSLSESEVYELFYQLLEEITFVSEHLVTPENKAEAFELCKNIDPDDIPFIALTLQINGYFWTGDKKLKKHLRQIGFTSFFEPKYEHQDDSLEGGDT
jgi:predicted nucleic acid-binding protein